MNDATDRPVPGSTLRRRAEDIYKQRTPETLEALSSEETSQTIHELRVHQIELEMQNEELLRAQAELEALRARYFDLYDLAPVSYFTISELGVIVEANLTAATLLGVHRSMLTRQPFTRYILKDDQDIHYLRRKQLFETGEPQEYELRMLTSAGTIFWGYVTATVARNDRGATVCRMVVNDITKRKETDERLARLHRALHTILESAPVGICLTIESRLTWINRKIEEMFLYRREELEGETTRMLYPTQTAYEQLGTDAYPLLAQGGEYETIQELVRRDGARLWVRYHGKAIDPTNRYEGVIWIMEDITAGVTAEQELHTAREAAEAASRAKSEFLANMSHEIRTPMNGLLGMLQLLESTKLTDKQSEYLDIMRISSLSLLSLINDILDLARIESGRMELEQRDFSLRNSISDVIKTQLPLIDGKEINMHADIASEVPDNLIGDQLRLKQIVLNLLGNAVKFTAKGEIRLTVDVVERQADNALLRIGVTDSGIGIRPEALKKIFEPFTQADSSNARKYGGAGLGLSICRRISELMGGEIRAESQEGVGSSFFAQIPFAVNAGVVARLESRSSNNSIPRCDTPLLILLVDDEKINRQVAMEILRCAEHIVREARDGREALERWEHERFDVILMDVQMPVMNGIEATHVIREMEEQRGGHVPIIAVTARAMYKEREYILRQGFDGYVAKPFNIEELLGEMKRCLAPD